jgi:hypothetical protein
MYTAALYSDTVYSIYYIVLLYVSSLGIQDRTNSYVPQKDEVMSVFGIIEIQRTAAKMSQEKLKIKKA